MYEPRGFQLKGTNASFGLPFSLKSIDESAHLSFSLCVVKYFEAKIPGAPSGGATPVPIPNTVVKPSSVDGTCLATGWESRPVPG